MGNEKNIALVHKVRCDRLDGARPFFAAMIPENGWKRTIAGRLPEKTLQREIIAFEGDQFRLGGLAPNPIEIGGGDNRKDNQKNARARQGWNWHDRRAL